MGRRGYDDDPAFFDVSCRKSGGKLVEVVDHNHSGALPRTVQVAGWMATPDKDRIIVIVGYRQSDGLNESMAFHPVIADLKSGFEK